MSERKPYIGMTDVPNAVWLRGMLSVHYREGETQRLLQAGVMMSYKSLNGLETKWAAAWPKNEAIAGIFVDAVDVLNCLHYADYDGASGGDDIRRALRYGGPHLNAVQLDMIWPKPELLELMRGLKSELRIILQVGAKALEQAGDDADTLIERLKPYRGLVDDVLLDRSGGQGLAMNPAHLETFIYELRARRPDLGIALAGGLGPDSLRLVAPLIRKFPELSIDAQGRLRASGSAMDPIDRERAEAYLRKAIALFRETD